MNKMKTLGLILPLTLALTLSACAAPTPATSPATKPAVVSTQAPATSTQTVLNTQPATQPQTAPTATKAEAGSSASALKLLQTIWAGYPESDQFPAAGGDPSEANSTMKGPGAFSLEDPAMADSILGLPPSAGADIADAASLMHMMNANTFTAGAFRVKDPAKVADLGEQLQANIQKRQWMCGFPEQLIILSVGDIAISAFGHSEIIETFKTQVLDAFGEAKVLVEEPIR